jgi:hypothetical protein
MMTKLFFGCLILACSVAPCGAAGLQLSIQDGKVSIDAQDVTVRQILTEWARIGQTRIVNIERLTGGPVTLKFDAIPEKQALDIVLRTIPGYMAAPREVVLANASMYDTILIMATTTAVAALRPPAPVPGAFQPNGNFTQLRQPGILQGPGPDPAAAADQVDDAAMAAAAAAGLLAVPAPQPGPSFGAAPMIPGAINPGAMLPGAMPPAGFSPNAPATTPAPTNPWNAPVGTPQPSLAPPPPPQAGPPLTPNIRPRPPQPDQ